LPVSADLLWLFGLGLITGIFGGYLGIGGALIITPILLEWFKTLGVSEALRFHLVFGTSLMAICGTAITASYSYARMGRVRWQAVWLTGSTAVVFSFAGSHLAALSSADFLKTFFVVFALASAAMLLIPRPESRTLDDTVHRWRLPAIGVVVGLVSAYIGVAGGVVMIPLFLLWAHLKTEEAPGTSNAVGVMTSIAGTIGYVINGWNASGLPAGAWGYVMPAVGLPLLIGTACGGPLGSLLNKRLGTKAFRFVFAIFLLAIAAKIYFKP
jgi:uncharacterized membrane protein YfcA